MERSSEVKAKVGTTCLARAVAACVALGLSFSATPAQADRPSWTDGEDGRRRVQHLIAVSLGGAVYLASETVLKGSLAPDQCRWCAPPSLDRQVRDALVWSDRGRADTLSNLSGYLAVPVLGLGITALAAVRDAGPAESRLGRVLDDTLPIVEAVTYGQLLVQLVKVSVGRQRPRLRFAEAPGPADEDGNLSFFSGHTSLAATITAAAAAIAHRRGSAAEPAIWAVGLGLTATTGYLRIAADEHYLTDVGAGALFGLAAGYLIPRLLHGGGGAPEPVSLVPGHRTLAIAGSF